MEPVEIFIDGCFPEGCFISGGCWDEFPELSEGFSGGVLLFLLLLFLLLLLSPPGVCVFPGALPPAENCCCV